MLATTVPYDTMSTTSRSDGIFTRCCCCFPLRIGCFILGYLSLILNTFHTLALVTVTTFVGITTHGFDHLDADQRSPDVPANVERPLLIQLGFLLIVMLCANVTWLLINIACLVGLHKKRPGPIRIYVGFATARLLLSLAGFVYLVMTVNSGPGWHSTQTIVTHSVDFGLAAYFVLVYYVYAVQLEREQAFAQEPLSTIGNDIAFIYPTKLDKETLVTKY